MFPMVVSMMAVGLLVGDWVIKGFSKKADRKRPPDGVGEGQGLAFGAAGVILATKGDKLPD